MPTSASSPLSFCSAAALRMAARRVSQFYDAYLAAEGLKVSQYSVLSVAARRREKAPTVNELADELGMDRSTLGHNLRPLARDGLIALESDPVDKRVRRVLVTELGRAKRRACRDLWAVAQARFEEAFGASRTAELGILLLSVARDLELGNPSDAQSSISAEESFGHVR
ncbi:MAG: winged helix-turn-helix transcriptional regulator [Hyphomicrobiales bacterium]|nr:winged helix-turn-helix transcriptional regulator [Hyphomicrobiales bacterium]